MSTSPYNAVIVNSNMLYGIVICYTWLREPSNFTGYPIQACYCTLSTMIETAPYTISMYSNISYVVDILKVSP